MKLRFSLVSATAVVSTAQIATVPKRLRRASNNNNRLLSSTSSGSSIGEDMPQRILESSNNIDEEEGLGERLLQSMSMSMEYIVGGMDASPDQFPWMVSITDGDGNHKCAGTLISPSVVLTSSLCFSDSSTGDFYVEEGAVAHVGQYDLTTNTDMGIPICTTEGGKYAEENEAFVVRYGYDGYADVQVNMDDVDMALLIVPDAMMDIKPINLNSEPGVHENEGAQLSAVGWGVTSQGDNPGILQFTNDLKYVPNEDCNTANVWMGRVGSWEMCTSFITFVRVFFGVVWPYNFFLLFFFLYIQFHTVQVLKVQVLPHA